MLSVSTLLVYRYSPCVRPIEAHVHLSILTILLGFRWNGITILQHGIRLDFPPPPFSQPPPPLHTTVTAGHRLHGRRQAVGASSLPLLLHCPLLLLLRGRPGGFPAAAAPGAQARCRSRCRRSCCGRGRGSAAASPACSSSDLQIRPPRPASTSRRPCPGAAGAWRPPGARSSAHASWGCSWRPPGPGSRHAPSPYAARVGPLPGLGPTAGILHQYGHAARPMASVRELPPSPPERASPQPQQADRLRRGRVGRRHHGGSPPRGEDRGHGGPGARPRSCPPFGARAHCGGCSCSLCC